MIKHKFLSVAILFTIVCVGVGVLMSVYASTRSASAEKPLETVTVSKYDQGPPDPHEMLELVNAERSKYGVAPLTIDARLNQSAQMKADDMVKYNYFGHVNHDGTQGVSYGFNTMNHECYIVSENLTDNVHDNTSQSAFNAWVKSKPHHDAMISAKDLSTGFAYSDTKVVEHFCVAK